MHIYIYIYTDLTGKSVATCAVSRCRPHFRPIGFQTKAADLSAPHKSAASSSRVKSAKIKRASLKGCLRCLSAGSSREKTLAADSLPSRRASLACLVEVKNLVHIPGASKHAHTRTRTRARTHARMHARTHARRHKRRCVYAGTRARSRAASRDTT